LISLAKQLEQVFVLGEDSPINEGMDVDSPAMRLLRRVRDEAHRFAVSYHRTLRKAAAFQSAQPTVDRQAATAPKTYDDA
jgi:excinuclease ABC subunit C